MSFPSERRIDKLQRLLKSRTKADGTPRPGFEQNVATIRAQIEQLTVAPPEDSEEN